MFCRDCELGAYKLHYKVKVGEWVDENKLKLEPQNIDTYVLLLVNGMM
jgi:hypothetical protein